MKRLPAALLVAALAAASTARADDATRSGFSVGVRGAYAWPFGDVVSGTKADDVFDRMIPLWADATIRLGGGLEIGPYFQYGWIKGATSATDAKDWRLGAQLNFRLTPAGGLTPWVGVGAGWEWLKTDNVSNADLSGLDLMAQGGFDFRLAPNVAVGPFAAITFGRYSSGDIFDLPGSPDKAWHEWLHVGARLTLDI